MIFKNLINLYSRVDTDIKLAGYPALVLGQIICQSQILNLIFGQISGRLPYISTNLYMYIWSVKYTTKAGSILNLIPGRICGLAFWLANIRQLVLQLVYKCCTKIHISYGTHAWTFRPDPDPTFSKIRIRIRIRQKQPDLNPFSTETTGSAT